jgi:uncharacterized YigZ family protein
MFREFHDHIRQLYKDATHVTYAYRIQDKTGFHCKASDDGEPSGTAGRPILNHLEGRDLLNCAIFVVRYFGGTKLGAGGLVRAYGAAARQALDEGEIIDHVPMETFQLTLSYDRKNQFDYQLNVAQGQLLEEQYGAEIQVSFSLPTHQRTAFFERLGLPLPDGADVDDSNQGKGNAY